MKGRQGVIRHHREHVMLDVVVHVPVEESYDGVHVDSAAVEPVVQDILVKSEVLRDRRAPEQGSAVKRGEPHEEERHDIADHEAQSDDAGPQ